MARRTLETFSASPSNLDAQLVLGELKKLPSRERSSALWHWAAEFLRGHAREQAAAETVSQEQIDEISDLLADL